MMITSETRALALHNLEAASARLLDDDIEHALQAIIDTVRMVVRDEQPAPAPAPARAPEPARSWLPGALVWRCGCCPRVLGYVIPATADRPARFMVKHFKREITFAAADAVEQVCDGCGATNRWPAASSIR